MHVEDRGLIDAWINFDGAVEASLVGVEFHVFNVALGSLDVRSTKVLDLFLLQTSIMIVEALRFVSSRASQVIESLELPVSP